MPKNVSREIRLRSYPGGMPSESDFELAEVTIPDPGKGEVLVENIFFSVDPYMRLCMNDRDRYIYLYQLGETLDGGCVGKIVKSNSEKFHDGDYVSGELGWREYFLSDGSDLKIIDANKLPLQTYLGPLGATGMTAYFGLLEIGQPKAGENIFVSAASGAVGSIVCQIAKIVGCRVVGSAGSNEKIAWLKNEAKVDAAINYKEVSDLSVALGKHFPHGIDIYFDNVGGSHLESTLTHMNKFGRIALCGMISQYNLSESGSGPANLMLAVIKRLTLRGFTVSDYEEQESRFYTDMKRWIDEDRLKWNETIIDGIENAPKAFIGLFRGENFGKMLVRVNAAPEN